MKKFLLAAATAALFSVNGFAAFVQCTPNTGNVVDTGAAQPAVAFTCSPSALAGNIAGDSLNVISIQLLVSVSAQQTGGQTSTLHQVNVTMSNNAGLNNVSTNPINVQFVSSAGTGAGSASTGDLFAPITAVAAIDEFGSFTVTMAASAVQGSPLPANATASVYYQATTQSTGVPEPSSLALLGSALVGLGLVARRKK